MNRLWLLAVGILILIILASSAIIWLGRDPGHLITISTPKTSTTMLVNVIVDGAVCNPGSYPEKESDTLQDLINAAGGLKPDADISKVKLIIPSTGSAPSPQKIDINRAEVWLLQSLSGIGETRAQAIVDYRSKNGPFKNINEIMQVPGVSVSTFTKIKGFITISE
jgi:competence protein ComEA